MKRNDSNADETDGQRNKRTKHGIAGGSEAVDSIRSAIDQDDDQDEGGESA